VLIAQAYSDSDDLAFIAYIAKYLRDPRYLRVAGRPLLLVYRPGLFPDARRTATRWREWCRANGLGEIYLAYTQSFEAVDPAQYGFDAAIEFPPNNTNPPLLDEKLALRNPHFKGTVYDWRAFVARSRDYRPPSYRLFRGVCPSWDNEARRPGRGVVFQHASPAGYREWLGNAIADTRRRIPGDEERLIFVNAWNEWAEGAHLEPDQRYGFAWLEATREALIGASKARAMRRIVVVSHDAHPHGAQYLSLHLARLLHRDFGYEVDLVLLGDGLLREEMARTAKVHEFSGVDPLGSEAKALARALEEGGADLAIVNTTVSGLFLTTLSEAGVHCISLIHELPGIIKSYGLQKHARAIAAHARQVVFASEKVAQPFRAIAGMPEGSGLIRPQGLYKRNARRGRLAEARATLRDELGVVGDAQIVLGVGYADRRKGVDLFVQAGLQVALRCPRVHFVWVGHWEPSMDELVQSMLRGSAYRERFHFVGRKNDTDLYYAGADVYALSSREDPFPTVIMESLEVGVPVVAFRDTGGGEDLLALDCGRLVANEDAGAFAEAIIDLLAKPAEARALGAAGKLLVAERFSFRQYVFDLLEMGGAPFKRVSVAVPNYNYGRYLAERLSSITAQTYPIFELIILDDASQDDSLRLIEEFAASTELDCRIVVNERNSGSVFRQWQTAAEMARGDFLWICEADDVAEPGFLARVLRAFDDPQTVLSYCQSKQIDDVGRVLAPDYLAYTDDVCAERWRQDFVQEGRDALASTLAVKNTIPNVSAAVFRRQAFLQAVERCRSDLGLLRVAGDWLVYSELLRQGKLAFCAEVLNRHRRHQAGVTISNFESERHLAEILFMQERVAAQTRLSEITRAQALAFARQVQEQFGLIGQERADMFTPSGARAALGSQQSRETAS
jgi:glycosyltransferase involved in cell wall biosynthesis